MHTSSDDEIYITQNLVDICTLAFAESIISAQCTVFCFFKKFICLCLQCVMPLSFFSLFTTFTTTTSFTFSHYTMHCSFSLKQSLQSCALRERVQRGLKKQNAQTSITCQFHSGTALSCHGLEREPASKSDIGTRPITPLIKEMKSCAI